MKWLLLGFFVGKRYAERRAELTPLLPAPAQPDAVPVVVSSEEMQGLMRLPTVARGVRRVGAVEVPAGMAGCSCGGRCGC